MRRLVLATALVFAVSGPAAAFECPEHIDEAQSMIDKVAADMKGMGKDMPQEKMALVHALLDDAKMFLASAIHNHEKPQGNYDHARSIAKADAALGYARASDMLHFLSMTE
jgi:hypothetical protein